MDGLVRQSLASESPIYQIRQIEATKKVSRDLEGERFMRLQRGSNFKGTRRQARNWVRPQ